MRITSVPARWHSGPPTPIWPAWAASDPPTRAKVSPAGSTPEKPLLACAPKVMTPFTGLRRACFLSAFLDGGLRIFLPLIVVYRLWT
jgi:hypothetical protein